MGDLKSYLDSLKNMQVAVIGAGISNTPLINALLTAGIDTTVRDKRSHNELGEIAEYFKKHGAKLKLGEDYLGDITENMIFRTPGLMPTDPALIEAVAKGAVLTSEMEVFFDVCPCRIIGITGSDGKTTTTSIIAEMLKREGLTVHVGGNIGKPLLCEADNMDASDIAVLELSSFQLITLRKSPDIAVVTNLSPNHLDIHKDMNEYIEAKRNIFAYQNKSGRAVFNIDNEYTRAYAETAPAGEVLYFGNLVEARNGVFLKDDVIYISEHSRNEAVLNIKDILIPGSHNIENYMAAIAALRGMVSNETILETARSFKGVEHRIEFIRELHGVKYYNDSIASSPTRCIAGLKSFSGQKIILIAGGKDKGVAFDELGGEINKYVKMLVLTGLTSQQIKEAVINAPNYTGTIETIICEGFKEAVLTASQNAENGDIVLLSPACTSFDRFKNFEERGNIFKEIVREME